MPATTTSLGRDSVSTFNISQIQVLPLTLSEIKKATRHEKVLSMVCIYVQNGWSQQVQKDLQPYSTCQAEINIEGGCLMWGLRVIAASHAQVTAREPSWHQSNEGNYTQLFLVGEVLIKTLKV